jgi:hypothetical protein
MSKNNLFPIVEVDNHKLISIDSNMGYFYKLSVADLEQLDGREVESFLDELARGLDQLPTDHYYKFYRLNSENFVETSDPHLQALGSVTFKPCDEHLKSFFKTERFLSDAKIFDDYMLVSGTVCRLNM